MIWIIAKHSMLAQALIRFLQRQKIPFVATTKEEVSVLDPQAIQSFLQKYTFSHVINCAAFTQVDAAEAKPQEAAALNTEAPQTLARLLPETTFLCHISTDYVFSSSRKKPCKEEEEINPINIYGMTKANGEKAVLQQKSYANVVRVSWLFGWGKNHFVRKILDRLLEQDDLKVSISEKSRPTFCEDLAPAIIALLDHTGIWHLGSDPAVDRYTFAQEILIQAKQRAPKECHLEQKRLLPIDAKELSLLAQRPVYSVLDCTKFTQNFFSLPSWKKGLQTYIDHYFSTLYANL